MDLFRDTSEINRRYSRYIDDLRRLFIFHGLPCGAPEDLGTLSLKLAESNAFRTDVSALARNIRDLEAGSISAGEMLSVIVLASGGEDLAEGRAPSAATTRTLGPLRILLSGVGGWSDATEAGESLPTDPPARNGLSRHERSSRSVNAAIAQQGVDTGPSTSVPPPYILWQEHRDAPPPQSAADLSPTDPAPLASQPETSPRSPEQADPSHVRRRWTEGLIARNLDLPAAPPDQTDPTRHRAIWTEIDDLPPSQPLPWQTRNEVERSSATGDLAHPAAAELGDRAVDQLGHPPSGRSPRQPLPTGDPLAPSIVGDPRPAVVDPTAPAPPAADGDTPQPVAPRTAISSPAGAAAAADLLHPERTHLGPATAPRGETDPRIAPQGDLKADPQGNLKPDPQPEKDWKEKAARLLGIAAVLFAVLGVIGAAISYRSPAPAGSVASESTQPEQRSPDRSRPLPNASDPSTLAAHPAAPAPSQPAVGTAGNRPPASLPEIPEARPARQPASPPAGGSTVARSSKPNTPERQTSERQTPERQTPERQTPERPARKPPETAAAPQPRPQPRPQDLRASARTARDPNRESPPPPRAKPAATAPIRAAATPPPSGRPAAPAVSAGKATNTATGTRVVVPEATMRRTLIATRPPVYPPDALKQNVEGTVVLNAVIAKDGSIKRVDVVRGSPVFIKSAMSAVSWRRYKPYVVGGKPVEVETPITVVYTVH